MATIQRGKSLTATVGGVRVGSDAPVVVQSMTNTDTADIASTVQQCAALARAGSELVRVTVNHEEAAAAVPRIVEELDEQARAADQASRMRATWNDLVKTLPGLAQRLP